MYFQKLIWFYLLATKIVYWAKFEGKLSSDVKCPGPLLQRSPLNPFFHFLLTDLKSQMCLKFFMSSYMF